MNADPAGLATRWRMLIGPMPSQKRIEELDEPAQRLWREVEALIGLGSKLADALEAAGAEITDLKEWVQHAEARAARAEPETPNLDAGGVPYWPPCSKYVLVSDELVTELMAKPSEPVTVQIREIAPGGRLELVFRRWVA